jgi:antitoxin PrlF
VRRAKLRAPRALRVRIAYAVLQAQDGTAAMTLLKVRERSEITLPREIRDALNLREGDYLEAEVVEGGVLLKAVPVVDREAAWREIREAQASVRPTRQQAAKTVEEQEHEILEVVNEVRRQHGHDPRRR